MSKRLVVYLMAMPDTAELAEAAVEAAGHLGFPVALKVDSPDILHKTEAGVDQAEASVTANSVSHASG